MRRFLALCVVSVLLAGCDEEGAGGLGQAPPPRAPGAPKATGGAPAAAPKAGKLLIASFESKKEFFRWEKLRLPVQKEHQVMGMELATTGATDGKQALKIHQPLEKQRISWGLAEGLPSDWSMWQEIAFDVTYQGEGPGDTVGVSLIVDDVHSTGEWKDVFHGGFNIRKGTTTCRVGIHEIATRVEVKRIRQITFTHSGNGPATWYIDNVRLEGARAQLLPQATPAFRVSLPEPQRLQWCLGDDFRRFQIVADGYYEPKGWQPSSERVAKLLGLAFTEYSTRAPGRENSKVVLRLKRDVPKFHASKGLKLTAGPFDPTALPREAGSVEFWIKPKVAIGFDQGTQTFLHAVKDLENQVKIGYIGGDLFFEIREKGERHIVRYWDQTIWGDIRKAPARLAPRERHHVRLTWGPEGMYLNVNDEEVPYNVYMIHRKPEDEPAPTPYKAALPEGFESLTVGSNVDGTAKAGILDGQVFVTRNGKRGPRWGKLPYVRKGTYFAKAVDRGKRFAEPEFKLGRFLATVETPPGTSVEWRAAPLAGRPVETPKWQTVKPGQEMPEEFNKARYLMVQAKITGNGKATPEIDEWHIIQYSPPHPRIFITAERLAKIRERIKAEPLKTLYDKLLAIDPKNRGHLHNAFLYWLTKDDKWKAEAAADFTAAMASKKKPREHWDIVGCEWMLGFLEGAEREKMLKHVAGLLDRGIPRDNVYWNQSMNGWRHALHRGMFANVALVGEEGPWVHDARHSFRSYEDFLKQWMIPAFNQAGGAWPEGFGYHSYTGEGPALAIEAWKGLTGEDLWDRAAPHFKQLGAWYAHHRQPHTNAAVHVNDDSGRTRWLIWSWTNLLGDVYGDRYLRADAQKIIGPMTKTRFWRTREGIKAPGQKKGVMGYFDLLQPLLWFDPAPLARAEAAWVKPRARHFAGMDWIATRSDWSKDATLLAFIPYDWYGGHKQVDTGSFLISKGGELVDDPMDSRRWASKQHFGYRMKSAAHNVLYAGEPDRLRLGDGGQIRNGMPMPSDVIPDSRYDTAEMLAYKNTQHYTWMSADLTGAYRVDRKGGVRRVQRYTRSILFLRPDVIVVRDRVLPTAADSRLAFVLHNSAAKPDVTGKATKLDDNVTLYEKSELATLSAGRGKLYCRAVMPEGAVTLTRKVPGLHKDDKPIEKATVWHLEYEAPGKPEVGKWIDYVVVMRATVDDKGAAPKCTLKKSRAAASLKIEVDDDTWDLTLDRSGKTAGHVRLVRGGKKAVDDKLEWKVVADRRRAPKLALADQPPSGGPPSGELGGPGGRCPRHACSGPSARASRNTPPARLASQRISAGASSVRRLLTSVWFGQTLSFISTPFCTFSPIARRTILMMRRVSCESVTLH